MTLHLYFARRFLMVFLALLALFALMLGLIDMLEQIRTHDTAETGFGRILRLTLLNMPQGLYRILPLVAILAAIVLFLNLARSSELVVARASGRSALHALAAPVAVALALGVLAVAALDPIVAATQKEYQALSVRARQGTDAGSVLSLGRNALWLRQGGAEGQTVIRAGGTGLGGTELRQASFLSFDATGTPVRRIEAEEARLEPGRWRIEGAKVWDLTVANPEAAARHEEVLELRTDLTRERIRDSFGLPSSVPIWELPAFIRDLEASGFSARSQRTWLQMELALPLLLAAMVMIGAGFTMRPARLGRTGLMVLLALGLGFAIFFLRNFAQILGERGQLPVVLAAWAPPLIAVLVSTGLLLHLEDG